MIAQARRWESLIGRTYNELAMTDRHLGRGFALAGFYHPRSRISETTTYVQMLDLFNRRMSFWDEEFREKNIDLVVNGSVDLAVMAKARNIPMRRLNRSRFANYYYWSFYEKLLHPGVEKRFHESSSSWSDPLRVVQIC